MNQKITSIDRWVLLLLFSIKYGLLVYISSQRICGEYSFQNIVFTWLSEFSQKTLNCSQAITNFYTKNIFLLDSRHVAPLVTLSHPDSFPELLVSPRELHFVQEIWDRVKQTKATYKGPVKFQFPKDLQKNGWATTPRSWKKGTKLNWFSSCNPSFPR